MKGSHGSVTKPNNPCHPVEVTQIEQGAHCNVQRVALCGAHEEKEAGKRKPAQKYLAPEDGLNRENCARAADLTYIDNARMALDAPDVGPLRSGLRLIP